MYYQRVLLGAAGYLNPAVYQAPQSCFELRLISSLTILLGLGKESSLEAHSGGSKPTLPPGGRGALTNKTVRAVISPTSGGSGGISILLNDEGTVPSHTIEKPTENEPRTNLD